MTAEEFKYLFFPYRQKLYRLAVSYLGQSEDAEDAVQETYVRLWNRRDELSLVNVEAYSMTIVKNISLDLLRSKKRKGYTIDIENYDVAAEESLGDDSKEALLFISRWMQKLPTIQKRVFELRHKKEMSMKMISEELNLTESNVKVILSRLRKQLKEEYLRYE